MHQYSDIYYIENRKHMPMLTPQIVMNPREAYYSEKETISKEQAVGRISAEVIAECPPGISFCFRAELITQEHMPYLNEYKYLEVIKKYAKIFLLVRYVNMYLVSNFFNASIRRPDF